MLSTPRGKKHVVALTGADWASLEKVTTTGMHPASMIMRARPLLALDTNAGQVDYRAQIGEPVGVSTETVRLIAKRFVETGDDVAATIGRKKPPGPPPSPVRSRPG